MRIVIILFVVAIILSMGSALFYMVTDRSGGNRMLRALALRVGLSVTLFLVLIAGFYFGWIPGRIQ
ncbi:MAG: twin transmembrane helix small protein [Burkholderiales bacterium]